MTRKYFFKALFITVLIVGNRVAAIDVHVTAQVRGCGDAILDSNEQCDGNPVSHNSCSNLGFSGGTLGCTNTCGYDTSSCYLVQNSGLTPGSSGNSYISNILRELAAAKLPKNSVIFEGKTDPGSTVRLYDKNDKVVASTRSDTGGNYSVSAVNLKNTNNFFTLSGNNENRVFIVNMYSDIVMKYSNIILQSNARIIYEIISRYQKLMNVDLSRNQTFLLRERKP